MLGMKLRKGTLGRRRAGLARITARGIAVGTTIATMLAMLGGPAPAMAGIDHELAVFADCPLATPQLEDCVYSPVTGGEFVLGSKTVPINKTVTLQGGLKTQSTELVPAADGNTLSKTALTVPGGLTGIEGLGGEVTATAELAGPVNLNSTALLRGEGQAIALPLKVKLSHPVLGAGCFVGTEAEPVNLALTSGSTNPPGPNTSIKGNAGKLSFKAGGTIDLVSGTVLVDNAFGAPGASGCGVLPLIVDPLVNVAAGLPSAAGKNTAIMNAALELASPERLQAQLALPEIGRCVKVKKETGKYFNNKCTQSAEGEGNFEWFPGPSTAAKFTGKATKTTLQGVGGATVKCSAATSAGEYTGAKTLTASLKLTGCQLAATKAPCQSSGAASGEINTSTLAGKLRFIQDESTEADEVIASVGVDLSNGSSLVQAECAGAKEALVVNGSVIAPVSKANAMSTSFSLAYAASSGKQEPEAFEEEAKDTLTATLGSGAEQAGLTTTQKFANEEKLEIKSITE